MRQPKVITLEEVTIRFAGDSGDGIQLTGTLYSDATAHLGNDILTFPDYPAEIRAPKGTIGGVSGFQIHFGDRIIKTPGDYAHVLVAMNPAALKVNAGLLNPGGVIIFDTDTFTEKNFKKAEFETNDPFAELKMDDYIKMPVPVTSLTKEALKEFNLEAKTILRSKNMFTLGLVSWIFNRPVKYIEELINDKFSNKPTLAKANIKVLHSGYNYGLNIQHMTPRYIVHHASIEEGVYRNVCGNRATAWGFIAAAEKAGLELFAASYPITPATEIFITLAERKDLGVKTFQAEDEIASVASAIGASFAGSLAITTTSGPGLSLKSEGIGLAVMAELPLVVVNVQRGGPSTGLPTKTEQSDLLQALYGRNGESPVAVIAASTPSDCFLYAYLAAKIALEHMVPVILLSDGFLANGSEPWKIPLLSDLPPINIRKAKNASNFKAYKKDNDLLSREWAVPGMAGFEHIIGGLEKNITGSVSYEPETHQRNTVLRQKKIEKIAEVIPPLKPVGDVGGEVLIVGWGGTFGHPMSAMIKLRKRGNKIGLAHFNYIKPLPLNTKTVFEKFKKIVVCELNMGQFADYLQSQLPGHNYIRFNKINGLPFTAEELVQGINRLIKM